MSSIENRLESLIKEIIWRLYRIYRPIDIIESNYEDYDYQSNIGFILSKILDRSPKEVIEEIVELYRKSEDKDFILEVSGKGFLSIRYTDDGLENEILHLQDYLNDIRFFDTQQDTIKVLIDYGSPNIAKPLHTGNLRSLIIGDAISRVLEYKRCRVERINHIGDCGTQFGFLLAYYNKYPDKFPPNDVTTLGVHYKESKDLSKEDNDYLELARRLTLDIQTAIIEKKVEEEIYLKYKYILDLYRDSYEDIFSIMNICKDLIEKGESSYLDKAEEVIEELLKKGIAYIDKGATCVRLNDIVSIIKKSNGSYTYLGIDLTALKERKDNDIILYVVDNSQKDHFETLASIGVRAGWIERSTIKHINLGLIKNEEGKKISSRDSTTYLAKDLIEEAINKCKNKTLAITGIKYLDLSKRRDEDYIFNPDSILKMEENSISYIYYSLYRIRGIIEKVREDRNFIVYIDGCEFTRNLYRLLIKFESVLDAVTVDYRPHLLTNYIYQVCKAFSKFYDNCPVITGDRIDLGRLTTISLVDTIIRETLDLLGIDSIERLPKLYSNDLKE